MDSRIILVGLNHHTASVDIREKFALKLSENPDYWLLSNKDKILESLILSTCNRVEILAVKKSGEVGDILKTWADSRKASLTELSSCTYIQNDKEAVRHIFEVASSLDSMILGEPQILGQLKNAYRLSVENNQAGPIINRLMHKAFSVAKRVRTETAIAANAVSVSYAAIELAKRIFGQLPGHAAMILGAGEMAELAARHLTQNGIEKLVTINRTFERAQDFASRFGGISQPFEKLDECLGEVDIVIASTSSPTPIIKPDSIEKALKKRKNRPMFLIDIAVPRDIDPAVNAYDNVYLYDIDDLKEVIEENMANRRKEADKARSIIAEETESFWIWLNNLDSAPTILDLIKRGETAAREELARALKRLGPVSDEATAVLERMAFSLVKKLNHDPITFLKRNDENFPTTEARVSAVRDIFNLDKDLPRKINH